MPLNVVPPGPVTGFSRKGCYLNGTSNCSDDLTGEHVVSKGILQIVGKKSVSILYQFWQPKDKVEFVGINALTANILCKRHNEAISPLDAEAKGLFSLIHDAFFSLPPSNLNNPGRMIEVSGEAFERWMLKVCCGKYYSKQTSFGGKPVIENFSIDDSLIADAFNGQWKPHCGMFVKKSGPIEPKSAVGFEARVDERTGRFLGGNIHIYGVSFSLFFDSIDVGAFGPSHTVRFQQAGWWSRPTRIVLNFPKGQFLADLRWPAGTPENIVSQGAQA